MSLTRPRIEGGLAAVWVGVGGPRQSVGRKDSWIQVGLVAYSYNINHLYFEVDQPGTGTRYTEVVSDVPVGSRYRVGVLEIASRPGWWQVWLNGAPASAALRLPGSSGRWRPIATAETWQPGEPACNHFAYRFEQVAIATAPGGGWTELIEGEHFNAPGYRMLRVTKSTFLVTST